jgi:hypothetical protein
VLVIASYLLVIVGWMPDSPAETMGVRREFFVSKEACEAAGSEYVAQREIYKDELGGGQYKWFCLPAPDKAEIDAAIKDAAE